MGETVIGLTIEPVKTLADAIMDNPPVVGIVVGVVAGVARGLQRTFRGLQEILTAATPRQGF